jgi:CSLREA domain-containing protein
MKTRTPYSLRRLLLATAVAGLFPVVTSAATLTVNTPNDVVDPVDNLCSLREAVIAANTNTASGNTTNFPNECIAGEAAPTVDVINVPAGTYTLSIAPEDATPTGDINAWTVGEYTATWQTGTYVVTVNPDATVGDIDITESVKLVGAGSAATIIDAGWVPVPWDVMAVGFDPKVDPVTTTPGFGDRVFHVVSEPLAPGASVAIDVQMSGLTIKGGQLTTVAGLTAPNATEYYLRRSGGGIGTSIAAGTYDPLTTGGGGDGGNGAPPANPGGEEGGATYSLALTDVVVTSNYAGDGGGLYNAAVSTITTSTISNNRGNANGGGVYNDAPLTALDSTISGNSAEGGGGMFDTGSHTTFISGTTLSGNGAVGGGGLSSRAGVTNNVVNSTISGNFGFDVGGGIYTNGRVNLIHVTLANNVSNSDAPNGGAGINTFPSLNVNVTLRGTLLATNLKGTVPATRISVNCGKTSGSSTLPITSVGIGLGYNLSTDSSCLLAGIGDMQGTVLSNLDAKLAALADNGGPTLTHALEAASPAINAAAAITGLTTDQRGVTRDATPDIGAYEYPTAPVVPKSSSKCFIATAAFGTPMQDEVRYLRAFRDQYLLTNDLGRKVVELYYTVSPPVADYIREHDTLRSVVRTGLRPLVEMSRQLTSAEAVDATK